MSALRLAWMRAEAPYMPIATLGLIDVLRRHEPEVSAVWSDALTVNTKLSVQDVAELVAQAPLPNVDRVAWPTRHPQALGPSLETTPDPLATYRELLASADAPERRLLLGVATEQVIGENRIPTRTRLLRGAKSDLSAFKTLRAVKPDLLVEELRLGPRFDAGKSGELLGLAPEVQTFGGTTGREPSSIGASSPLLARLLRHGILSLPPVGVLRNGRRVVGGPLVNERFELSWPIWTVECGVSELRVIFAWEEVHAETPRQAVLAVRGVEAVYRASLQKISTTVEVFRWGRRVT